MSARSCGTDLGPKWVWVSSFSGLGGGAGGAGGDLVHAAAMAAAVAATTTSARARDDIAPIMAHGADDTRLAATKLRVDGISCVTWIVHTRVADFPPMDTMAVHLTSGVPIVGKPCMK